MTEPTTTDTFTDARRGGAMPELLKAVPPPETHADVVEHMAAARPEGHGCDWKPNVLAAVAVPVHRRVHALRSPHLTHTHTDAALTEGGATP